MTSVTEHKTSTDNLSITDTTVNHYDNFDRLLDSTQRGLTVSYGYDNNGNRTSVSTPAGSTTYTFDSRNRIETANADGLTTTYTYYADGKKNTISYPNGTSVNYAYHPTNRVKTVTNKSGETVLSYYAYSYDKNGNRLWQTETQSGITETTTYAYDRVDRLLNFKVTGVSETRLTEYTYEGYNRKTEKLTQNGTVIKDQTYTYDETDWLRRIDNGAKTVTYDYDENGNTIRKSDNSLPNQDITYSYDGKNQLIETRRGIPGNEVILGKYDYNAQGLRIRHRLSERGDVDYFYDGRSVIEEHNANDNTLLAHYRYADRLVSLDTGGSKQYYHYDALGSTVNLTDEAGLTPVSYQLDPWGHIRNQFGISVNRHVFTGKEHDENTGLIYFGARYYDPDTARFLTQDAYLGQQDTPPSLHRYLYAYSNPTVYIDLMGYLSADEAKQAFLKFYSSTAVGMTADLASKGLDYLSKKADEAVSAADSKGYGTAGAVIGAGVQTVITVGKGVVDAPKDVGLQTIDFVDKPKLENVPVLGPQGQNIGESWGKAIQEGGFENYSVAVGQTLLGVATAFGGAEMARTAGVRGTSGNRSLTPGKAGQSVTESLPKPDIEPTITAESKTGASESVKALNAPAPEPAAVKQAVESVQKVEPSAGGEIPFESATKWGAEHGKGNLKHNNAIEAELDWAENQGAANIMKNKRQYDISGNKVDAPDGVRINPDAAYTLDGTRYNTNYVSNHQLDNIPDLNRELNNFKRMQSADPNAVNSLILNY